MFPRTSMDMHYEVAARAGIVSVRPFNPGLSVRLSLMLKHLLFNSIAATLVMRQRLVDQQNAGRFRKLWCHRWGS